MSMTVERCLRRLDYTLGGSLPSAISPIELINDVGDFMVTLNPWRWLEHQQVEVDFRANDPMVRLPVEPSEVRGIIAYNATDSLVNSVRFTSWQDLVRLTTYGLQTKSFHHSVLTSFRPRPTNLLTYTESFSNALWKTGAFDPTVTNNNFANPLNGKMTATTLDDTDGANIESASYIVSGWLTASGRFRFEVYLHAGTAAASSIRLAGSGYSTATDTRIVVTWATKTGVVAETGPGAHVIDIDLLNDDWVRVSVDMDHIASSGELLVGIEPAGNTGSATGSCHVFGPQLRSVPIPAGATAVPTGMEPYVPVYEDVSPVGGEPEPVLTVWPVPVADESKRITLVFTGGWKRVKDDSDALSMPAYLNAWFIEALLAWGRGWTEEDNASLSSRVAEELVGPLDRYDRPKNILLRTAIERDLEFQPDYGIIQGGAVNGNYVAWDWGANVTVGGPA